MKEKTIRKINEKEREKPDKNYTFSKKDVEDTLKILNLKNYELRAIGLNKTPSETRMLFEEKSKKEEILRFVRLYNGSKNLYIGINERSKIKAEKEDILSVSIIVIDIDAKKQKEYDKYTAIEQEYEETKKNAYEVVKYLKENFKDIKPSIACSGSGSHIYIPIEPITITKENSVEIHNKLRAFHATIINKFKDVKIDNIGGLPFLIRLIGTLNIKSVENNERKPRLSYWVVYNGRESESITLKDHILNIEVAKTITNSKGKEKTEINYKCEEECLNLLKKIEICPALINAYKKIMLGIHTHEEKIGFINYLLKKNITKEEIHGLLKKSVSYNKEKLENKIIELTKYNHMPYNCDKWATWGLCNKKEGCVRITSPLYYKDTNEYKMFTCMKCKHKHTPKKVYENFKMCVKCVKKKAKDKEYDVYKFNKEDIINQITDFLCQKYIFKTKEDVEDILVYEREGKYKGLYTPAKTLLKTEFVNFDKLIDYTHEKKIIEKIKNRTLINKVYFNPRFLIPLNNCIIDIRNWDMKEHSPDYNLTQKLFIDFDGWENKRVPNKFNGFIEKITWEEQQTERQMLKEIVAVGLLPNNNYPVGLFLHGTGRNGKGLFIEIVKAFFNCNEYLEEGEKHPSDFELHATLTPHHLSYKEGKFELHKLENAYIICSDEISTYDFTEDSMLKEVLEGKEIKVEKKHVNSWNLTPRCVGLWGSNELPQMKNLASPIFTRVKVMILPFKFDERFKEAVDDLGRNVYKPSQKKEEILYPIIRDREEMKAILYQSLTLLKEICERGYLTDLDLEKKREIYKEESNPIETFLKKTTKIMNMGFIGNPELLGEYKKYCNKMDKPTTNERAFWREVNENWKEKYNKAQITMAEGKRPRGWYGVGWNEEYIGHGDTAEKRIQKRNSCKVNKEVGVDLDNHFNKL